MRSNILTKDVLDLQQRFNQLDADQQALFLDLVDPQPETQAKPKAKRRSRGKSARATGLAGKISGTIGIQRCEALVEGPDGERCGEPQGHALHEDSTYANYHAFETGKVASVGGG